MSGVITFRIDASLEHWVREQARELGFSESQFCRYLLETARGEDPQLAALKQVVWAIHAQLREQLHHLGPEIGALIERRLVEPWKRVAMDADVVDRSDTPRQLPATQTTGPLGNVIPVVKKTKRGRRGGRR